MSASNAASARPTPPPGAPAVLMCGTGEYTTGFVGGSSSPSDKKIGVVGLVMFDLRRRGLVSSSISMVGTSDKHAQIREHFAKNIESRYKDLDTSYEGFPKGKSDPEAYKGAIDAMPKGSAVTIFTPDPTHYPIALYALERGMHVLVTKPAVQKLEHHLHLVEAARKNGVLCMVEHHKRWDPAYGDAREKARSELGFPQFFYSYMSQPKIQLSTFKSWAGKESDISYYLSSHHVDVFDWMCRGMAVPLRVTASASKGTANAPPFDCVENTEDTITLLVDFAILDEQGNRTPGRQATGVFTASWAAPVGSGVHSEQGFHYVGSKGEIRVNQARRGYTVVREEGNLGSMDLNPFYMKYSPDAEGHFDGASGYGYKSLEAFIRASTLINSGARTAESYDSQLPTLVDTVVTKAILQAGRISLDEKRSVDLVGEGLEVRLK